jgi:hypothetical protein
VGHHGVQHTLDKLRLQGVRFEGMRALVKQFIEFCLCCHKMSRISPVIQATSFTMATYRFGERFDIDTVGPLPKRIRRGYCRRVFKIRQVDTSDVNVGRCESANRFRRHIRMPAHHLFGSRNAIPE